MFNRNRLPDPEEAHNLTDVNNGGMATDEDGSLEQDHNDTDVNTPPEGETGEEEDTTPPIHSLAVKTSLVNGKEQTEIIATISRAAVHATEETEYSVVSVVKDKDGKVQKDDDNKVLYKTDIHKHFAVLKPGGIVSKRLVVPGAVSAYQLANHIFNIASW